MQGDAADERDEPHLSVDVQRAAREQQGAKGAGSLGTQPH